jgi:hypothetical protein
MIIRNNLVIVTNESQTYDYNPSNYLIVVDTNIIHKATGLILFEFYDTNRLNRFIDIWGYSQVFQFGLVDCFYDDYNLRIDNTVTLQIMTELLIAFFNQESDHPMAWLLFE